MKVTGDQARPRRPESQLSRLGALAGLVTTLGLFGATAAHAQPGGYVVGAGNEVFFSGLLDRDAVARCGQEIKSITVAAAEVTYLLAPTGDGPRTALVLRHPSTCDDPVRTPRASFCVHIRDLETGRSPGCSAETLRGLVEAGLGSAESTFERRTAGGNDPAPPAEAEEPSVELAADSGLTPPSPARSLQFWAMLCLIVALVEGTLGVWGVRALRSRRLRPDLLLLAVFAGALALRLWADVFPSDIRAAWMQSEMEGGHQWAAGYAAWQMLLYAVLPPGLPSLAASNVVVGAAMALAAYRLVRLELGDRWSALAAAAMIAGNPVLARFSASDCAHIPLTLSVLLSLGFMLRWAREAQLHDLALGLGWAVLAGNLRYASLFLLLPVVLFPLGALRRPLGRRFLALVVAAPIVVVLSLEPLRATLDLMGGTTGGSPNWWALVENRYVLGEQSSVVMSALSLLGLVEMIRRPETRWRALVWVLTLQLLGMVSFVGQLGVQDTNYRYFLPQIALFCSLAGVGVVALVRLAGKITGAATPLEAWTGPGRWLTVAVALVGPFALQAPHRGFLTKTWTFAQELDFFVEHAPLQDPSCVLVTRGRWTADTGLEIWPEMGPILGVRQPWITDEDLDERYRDGACFLYFRSAACSAAAGTGAEASLPPARGDPRCREPLAGYTLTPVDVTRLAALPYVAERYPSEAVDVGFYRLQRSAEPSSDVPGWDAPHRRDRLRRHAPSASPSLRHAGPGLRRRGGRRAGRAAAAGHRAGRAPARAGRLGPRRARRHARGGVVVAAARPGPLNEAKTRLS